MPSAARVRRIHGGTAIAATTAARHAAPMAHGAIRSHAIEIVTAIGIETTAIGRPNAARSAGRNRQRRAATSRHSIPQRHRVLRRQQTASLARTRASVANHVVVGAAADAGVAVAAVGPRAA